MMKFADIWDMAEGVPDCGGAAVRIERERTFLNGEWRYTTRRYHDDELVAEEVESVAWVLGVPALEVTRKANYAMYVDMDSFRPPEM